MNDAKYCLMRSMSVVICLIIVLILEWCIINSLCISMNPYIKDSKVEPVGGVIDIQLRKVVGGEGGERGLIDSHLGKDQ